MPHRLIASVGRTGIIALLGIVAVGADAGDRAALSAAQRAFYNGQYDIAVAMSREFDESPDDRMAALELRSSALHQQLRGRLGRATDKEAALAQCAPCPDLIAEFTKATAAGQAEARSRLQGGTNVEALYYLGKFDLNFVWLHVDTLRKRTGWSEYWEGRRSLDAALKLNPRHIRAQVARAWIDYIVDTKMTRGFRWLLGGGNRKRALAVSKQAAADADASYFEHVEATFAYWDMQVRERSFQEATVMALELAREFPENPDLVRFLSTPRVSAKK